MWDIYNKHKIIHILAIKYVVFLYLICYTYVV